MHHLLSVCMPGCDRPEVLYKQAKAGLDYWQEGSHQRQAVHCVFSVSSDDFVPPNPKMQLDIEESIPASDMTYYFDSRKAIDNCHNSITLLSTDRLVYFRAA